MLSPKKVKYRKKQKGRIKGKAFGVVLWNLATMVCRRWNVAI